MRSILSNHTILLRYLSTKMNFIYGSPIDLNSFRVWLYRIIPEKRYNTTLSSV
jgi:hypothetical protein